MATAPFETETTAVEPESVALIEAIQNLDPHDEEAWTKGGKPDPRYLSRLLNRTVSAFDRDAAWEAIQAVRGETQPLPIPQADVKLPAPPLAEPTPSTSEKWGGKWAVTDSAAKPGKFRNHHISGMDNPPVPVGAEPTPMPRQAAVKFLGSGSCTVYDANGHKVERMPTAETEGNGKIMLARDEVVCRLGELTDDALLNRVNRLPGGEAFDEASDRATVERFYADTRERLRKESISSRDVDLDGMDASPELERMAAQDFPSQSEMKQALAQIQRAGYQVTRAI